MGIEETASQSSQEAYCFVTSTSLIPVEVGPGTKGSLVLATKSTAQQTPMEGLWSLVGIGNRD